MRLTYAVAPGFVARGGGAIINIASAAAVLPELFNGVYDATKAFVLVFSQSLHHELAEKGVRVQVVLPGVTATDLWRLVGTSIEHFPAQIVMSGADLVDAALAGFELGEFVTSHHSPTSRIGMPLRRHVGLRVQISPMSHPPRDTAQPAVR